VKSSKRPHLEYAVHNPNMEWAICECVQSQNGNICKHQVKVLRMMRPNLAEGKIARHLGTLKGTSRGGVAELLNPTPLPDVPVPSFQDCFETPDETSTRPRCHLNLERCTGTMRIKSIS
jgi:hypothetical protein